MRELSWLYLWGRWRMWVAPCSECVQASLVSPSSYGRWQGAMVAMVETMLNAIRRWVRVSPSRTISPHSVLYSGPLSIASAIDRPLD